MKPADIQYASIYDSFTITVLIQLEDLGFCANPENQAFFDAARAGRLLVGRCHACKEFHFYPRAVCPFCASERPEWVEAKWRGTIYAYSVLRRVTQPYALAYVTLEEGVTMLTNLTNLVDCDFDRLRIGDPVRVVFIQKDAEMIPMFKPLTFTPS